MTADHVLVLRPNIPDEEISEAVAEAFAHVGKHYDFDFDFTVSTRIVCTELIYRCYHHRGSIQFPLVRRLGRFTLNGDDIARLAIDSADSFGPAPFHVVALALKHADGKARWIHESVIGETLRGIQAGWKPAKDFTPVYA